MSMINPSADVANAVEPTVVPADMEYQIRIIACDGIRTNSAGAPYILPRFEIVGEPTSKDFGRYIGLPEDDMDPKKKARTAFALKTFMEAAGLDPAAGFDPEDLPGTTMWAILGVEYSPEYGEQNFVRKFITAK